MVRPRCHTSFLPPVLLCSLALLFGSMLVGCDRPFVAPPRPDLEIVSPDFSTVLVNPRHQLQVQASSTRGVARVEVNGDSLTYDEDAGLWTREYAFHGGLNRLVFSVTDIDGQVTHDTAYAMHGALVVGPTVPALPEPRGSHTATRLADGTIIVIGGASRTPGEALGTAVAWGQAGFRFVGAGTLQDPRSGHTATLLPDGRILVVGGTRREPAERVEDLVETVEIYDPETEQFSTIPVSGAPIRRAHHTATLHVLNGNVYVDLYGGLGDISYTPQPTFGVRWDLRRFELSDDRLTALSPAPGPSLDYALWGHSQTPIEAVETPDRFLVVGSNSDQPISENASFLVTYDPALGLELHTTGPPNIPRLRHASMLLANGFVATFGGFSNETGEVLNEPEIYSVEADRHFLVPPTSLLIRRYGLSATKLEPDRILLIGGFVASGQGVTAGSLLQFPTL